MFVLAGKGEMSRHKNLTSYPRFIRYNGMYAEQIAKAWIRSEILMPRHLTFTGKNEHYDKKKKEDK